MIGVVQTFGDDHCWHPHLHALVTRGGWDRVGQWAPVPFVDGEATALVFRHKVFSFLQAEGLLSEERARLLLSWRHSGFSVHTSVTVPRDDRDGLERLTRYLLRPPVSLERLKVGEHALAIAYAARCKPGLQASTAAAPVDPKDFLARVVMHIPDPRRHVIRYYGAYSSVVRARRALAAVGGGAAPAPPSAEHEPASLEWKAARRRWASLGCMACPVVSSTLNHPGSPQCGSS
ncbi:MAG TPA: transposase [Thermoanaerobaculaceae bacterium]|nr:transposase [Thermoanaerobaculaceae bacterium]HQU32998.1 transposase [Thermoanaerobaculaceae bacterium]